MLLPHFPFGANGLELLCGLAVFVVVVWPYRRGGPASFWALSSLIALALFISVRETSQFMTIDEVGILDQALDRNIRATQQLMSGAFGTTLPLTLAQHRIHEALGSPIDVIAMTTRMQWWLIGSLLIVPIANQLTRIAGRDEAEPYPAFTLAFVAMLLSPTILMSLRVTNYDMVSLLCAILAILFVVRGLREERAALVFVAVIFATLGAQEKLTAGPVLIVAIFVFAAMTAFARPSAASRFGVALAASLGCFLFVLATGLLFRSGVWLLGPPVIPGGFWSTATDAFVGWAWVLLSRFATMPTLFGYRFEIGAGVAVALSLLTAVAATIMPALLRIVAPWRASRLVLAASMALPVVILGLGVVGLETVRAYWAPYSPQPAAAVSAGFSINHVVLHTGAPTLLRHRIDLSLYAFGCLIVTIPTAIWALAGVGLAVSRLRDDTRARNAGLVVLFGTLCAAALAVPAAAVLSGIPFAHRYFNVSIGMMLSGLVICGLIAVARLADARARLAAVTLFCALVMLEVAPFTPLQASFRPIWLEYDDAERAETGRINPSWMGWGEELMMAGKELSRLCAANDAVLEGVPCKDINFRVFQQNYWLPHEAAIRREKADMTAIRDDGRDFYVFSRLFMVQRRMPAAEPVFTISARGYNIGWVYRGSDLARENWNFGLP